MNMNSHKNLILEPLSTVLKISLLQFKEPGTKISVGNNKITFNEPSIIQGFFRSWYGHRREDLHNLYHPLLQCIEWYDKNNIKYKSFYQECIKGLRLLLQTYDDHTTIHHTLIHYITILESKDPIEEENDEDVPVNPIVERFKDIWSESEIKMIYDILQLIISPDTISSDFRETYCKVLEDIIESKEKEVYEYISQVSTTY